MSERIIIERKGNRSAWTLEHGGERHTGIALNEDDAYAQAKHRRSCLWWKRNPSKPDNGAFLDVQPMKQIKSLEIGRAE